ncbi:MAG TPA: undecaprenyl-diphosphate phosphatase, partial [Verrucomicrobiota bacterium]|nr:undecaprenyl-diphosphate phosphatase [Verrucomicrobiota bacterium]
AGGQLLAAAFPGLSRSGSTILLALAMGLARPQATEFSFMLGLPTLLAAAVKEFMDFHETPPGFAIDWSLVLIGSIASAITAFLSVKWLLRFVQSHTFNGFGWYRILVGGAILLFAR